jgi:magnesium chelatase family protein
LPQGLDTATVAAAVAAAQQRQRERQGCLNSRLQPGQLLQSHIMAPPARQWLAAAAESLALSARATHRVLKVARSIADLEQREQVGWADVAEALLLRVPSSAPEAHSAQPSNVAQHPLAGAHL